jgi:hypothetical protein
MRDYRAQVENAKLMSQQFQGTSGYVGKRPLLPKLDAAPVGERR